ncbi:MAG: sensor histidine kinase [Nitrospirae bacterium]|nr:sensor histidine kinase [Nitrospirota bacterium]
MAKPVSFKTMARVINQLGEQLIRNDSIALLELIKNSYDADASQCTVTMENPNFADTGRIIIEDDGEGMDYETLSTAWLEIGTSYKEDLLKDDLRKRSPKYKRFRLGEKGIGRLGVHRLGKEIEIITRTIKSNECVLKINWDDISRKKYLEDVPVEIIERKPAIFTTGSGTKIIVKRLRVPWTRVMARDCSRSITSLNSPFESDDSFRVSFKIADEGSNWLEGLLEFSDIEHYKLFTFDVSMAGNKITSFKYRFVPWETMKKLTARTITHDDREMKPLLRMVYKEENKVLDIDLNLYQIGEVRFRGVIFDRDTRTLALGVQDKAGLKKYLDRNGGIRVFRDNMRVFDYGELGNDWLELGIRRINIPTLKLSNNIIIGAIYIREREISSDLREKTNREGFVENDAYIALYHAVRFALGRIESLRKTDKDLLRKHYGPKKTSEPVTTSITDLKDFVEKNVRDESARNEIYRYLDRIATDYEFITGSLIKSAGAGLNLIMVIHELEKIINGIMIMIKNKVSFDILADRVKMLSSLIEGYSILVKNSEKKVRSLTGLVEQCIFNMQFRFDVHKIACETVFRNRKNIPDAVCSESHVLNALMNLFDNSIWWLGYSKTVSPTIFIDISDELPGYVSIVVADNGPGFTKPTDEIIKPFVTDKPEGMGMGIGLHLTHQIMESLGGELIFPEMEIFEMPEKYEKGAKIALAFKRGGK